MGFFYGAFRLILFIIYEISKIRRRMYFRWCDKWNPGGGGIFLNFAATSRMIYHWKVLWPLIDTMHILSSFHITQFCTPHVTDLTYSSGRSDILKIVAWILNDAKNQLKILIPFIIVSGLVFETEVLLSLIYFSFFLLISKKS